MLDESGLDYFMKIDKVKNMDKHFLSKKNDKSLLLTHISTFFMLALFNII